MLKILIVDDERLARKRIDDALSAIHNVFPHEVVGLCDNANAALSLIEDEHPDVILLDIQMPGTTGLDLAKTLYDLKYTPAIIFLTAFEEYALDAFNVHANDYLLKPVKEDRLLLALQKVEALKIGKELTGNPTHITAHNKEQKLMVAVQDISVAESDWKYTKIHVDGNEYLTDYTLQRLEEEYPQVFCRIHRATLVNIKSIQVVRKLQGDDTKWVVLLRNDATEYPIARRLLSDIKQRLSM